MAEHVCRYLELLPDGSYFCGGCEKTYRLPQAASEPTDWLWCYEHPHDAARLIDDLRSSHNTRLEQS